VETLSGVRAGAGSPSAIARRIDRGDPEYPERLTHLHDPPNGLWARGAIRLPPDRMIGIVGTRRATEYGRRMANDLAFDLATAGWAIVSGLAAGIDAAAHRGALAAGGTTIAVLGCGVNHVYPKANRQLYEEIERFGLLLSEYPPVWTPRKFQFPERNRIIAALGSALVVVQAGERSGALITAGQALNLGREVLAVPGPADQPVSRGVHQLLREGAAVAETALDVLRQLYGPAYEGGPSVQATLFDADGGSPDTGTPGSAERLRGVLADGPAPVDELARVTGIEVSETLATLCRMEIGGTVRALPGHRFELVRHP
jgi:DNA processing protein